MLHVGLDLSRRRLDVCVIDDTGELVTQTASPPDADGLRHLAARLSGLPTRRLPRWTVWFRAPFATLA